MSATGWEMFAVYQIPHRLFPDVDDGANGRHHEWMSSPTFHVAGGSGLFWLVPTTANSQFPLVGVPVPPPTLAAGVRGMTRDCSAGGMEPNVAGWENVPAHWLTTGGGVTLAGAPCELPVDPADAACLPRNGLVGALNGDRDGGTNTAGAPLMPFPAPRTAAAGPVEGLPGDANGDGPADGFSVISIARHEADVIVYEAVSDDPDGGLTS